MGALRKCVVSDLEAEKQQEQFKKGIQSFPKDKLHHTETAEKNPLPDRESMFSIV